MLGMIKHSQSTQSNKFVISLQYLKKGREFIFCMQMNIKVLQVGIVFDGGGQIYSNIFYI